MIFRELLIVEKAWLTSKNPGPHFVWHSLQRPLGWAVHSWRFRGWQEGTSNLSISYLKVVGILSGMRGREGKSSSGKPQNQTLNRFRDRARQMVVYCGNQQTRGSGLGVLSILENENQWDTTHWRPGLDWKRPSMSLSEAGSLCPHHPLGGSRAGRGRRDPQAWSAMGWGARGQVAIRSRAVFTSTLCLTMGLPEAWGVPS